MFFSSWADILRTLLVGLLAYVALLFFIRISGKRSLSKLNAFDLIITVALGSALATVLMGKDITLADGVLALGLLLGLQFVVAWSQMRFGFVRKLVKSEPTLVVYEGKILEGALRSERVVPGEIYQVMRTAGFGSVADVHAVVLETDGSFSVIGASSEEGRSTLSPLGPVGAGGEVSDLGETRNIASLEGETSPQHDAREGPAGGRGKASRSSRRTKGRGSES